LQATTVKLRDSQYNSFALSAFLPFSLGVGILDRRSQVVVGWLLFLAGVGGIQACRTPTQITLIIHSDVKCDQLKGVSITVAKANDVEQFPPATITQQCTSTAQGSTIGTLVVVPRESKNEGVTIRIIAGLDHNVDECTADNQYAGCVIARRRLPFVPHVELELPIDLRSACKNVPCLVDETCVAGKCVTANIPNPEQCQGNTCSETILNPPTNSTGGAGGGAGSGGAGGSGTAGSGEIKAPTRRVLVAGGSSTCALLVGNKIRCWGNNQVGQLGYNHTMAVGDGKGPSIEQAGDLLVGSGTVVELSASGGSVCARFMDGSIRCWGYNGFGQLGYNTTQNVGDGVGPSIENAGTVPLPQAVRQVSVGGSHTCAVLMDQSLRCWGANESGQLGSNSLTAAGDGQGEGVATLPMVAVGSAVASVSLGVSHTCAILVDGSLSCWGRGANGQLGYNSTLNVGDGVGKTIEQAGKVQVGENIKQVALGSYHTCGLLESNQVRCWGRGDFGVLGYNSTNSIGNGGANLSVSAAGDVPIGFPANQVETGFFHTCALLQNQQVRCWGQLFHGTGTGVTVGDGVGPSIQDFGELSMGGQVVQITSGVAHMCALLANGHVRCWGENTFGQLGYGNTTPVGDLNGPSIVDAGDVPIGAEVQMPW
jgi:alpha-tubulin suppressor-like RCC1 family protein